jgi:hypothetical protein
MGDDVGDGETMPESRNARSDRRELDCLYFAADDAWRCPLPAPGTLLFAPPGSRGSLRGVRPW